MGSTVSGFSWNIFSEKQTSLPIDLVSTELLKLPIFMLKKLRIASYNVELLKPKEVRDSETCFPESQAPETFEKQFFSSTKEVSKKRIRKNFVMPCPHAPLLQVHCTKQNFFKTKTTQSLR